MFLKLSALLAMLFLSDAGGGAADGDGGDAGSDETSATSGDTSDTGGTASGTQSGDTQDRQPSANKLIKDFAKERGISVEQLLSRYDELETATQTEAERLTRERDRYKTDFEKLSTQLRDMRSESAFVEAASKARAVAPRTLFRAYRDHLEYDDGGNVTNIDAVIEAARSDEPELFKPATGTSDAGRQGDSAGGKQDANWLLRQLAESNH